MVIFTLFFLQMKELELKEILGQKKADCLKFIRDNGTFVSGTSSSVLNSGKKNTKD